MPTYLGGLLLNGRVGRAGRENRHRLGKDSQVGQPDQPTTRSVRSRPVSVGSAPSVSLDTAAWAPAMPRPPTSSIWEASRRFPARIGIGNSASAKKTQAAPWAMPPGSRP